MKWKIFGYELSLTKLSEKKGETLAKQGQKALTDKSLTAIYSALDEIENRGLKYSEYRVQKLSGISINTVKKYRTEIEEHRAKNSRSLLIEEEGFDDEGFDDERDKNLLTKETLCVF